MTNIKTFKTETQEYIHSESMGYAVKTRVEHCLKEGLLVYEPSLKDYVFTKKALRYSNFWSWLQGDSSSLQEVNLT